MAGLSYRPVSGLVFAAVAVAHAVRAVRALPVHIGDASFPVWLSWVVVAAAGALSLWAFRGRG